MAYINPELAQPKTVFHLHKYFRTCLFSGDSENDQHNVNMYESRPSNLYHLIENAYVQHDTTVQRLVFREQELQRMCKEKLEESITEIENGLNIILFEKLASKVSVLGLFGDTVKLMTFIRKSQALPESFTDAVVKDPTSLPFGIYAVTVSNELTWMFLWSPIPEQIERSVIVTSQRILQELCEKMLWFMDISSDDANTFIQMKQNDEDSAKINVMSVGESV